MYHKSRIQFTLPVYGVMAACCLLPGMGALREIFTKGVSVITGVHIYAICMYLFFAVWFIRAVIMRVEISDRAVTVRTFWRTRRFEIDDSLRVEEVLRPLMRRGVTLQTAYRKYLRVENDHFKIDLPETQIDKYDELKSGFESIKKSAVTLREIPPTTALKILDLFV